VARGGVTPEFDLHSVVSAGLDSVYRQKTMGGEELKSTRRRRPRSLYNSLGYTEAGRFEFSFTGNQLDSFTACTLL
jgi:hypothetical protein